MPKLLKHPASRSRFPRWLYLGLSLFFLLSISLAHPGLTLAVSIVEYPIPTTGNSPQNIISGPDGNLWFTEQSSIGKITPGGSITEYPLPTANSYTRSITSGPDSNIWFLENGKLGKITPDGVITEYTLPINIDSYGYGDYFISLTNGPDGNLWFTKSHSSITGKWYSGTISKITPTGVITEYKGVGSVDNITTGPDGNLWFIEHQVYTRPIIAKITPAGVITRYNILNYGFPTNLTSGPDGNLWFTEWYNDKISKITPTGDVTEYAVSTPQSGLSSIIKGRDGNLWFIEGTANKLGKITPEGIVTEEYSIPTANSGLYDITSGPDGNLWFTEGYTSKIGMLVITRPPTLTTAFGNASIPLGGMTNLTFKITNPNPATTLTGITFTDNLPSGLVVATPNNLTGSCNGTVTAVAGSSSVKLEGGTLAANKNCTIRITVRAAALGDKSNTTGPISAAESGVGNSSNTAMLSVIKPSGPLSQLRFAQLAPANGSVDLYVNRQLLFKDVTYGTIIPYLPYQPGNYAIDVVKAGTKLDTTDPLISEAIDLWNKEAYTYTILNFNDDPSANSYFYRDSLKTPATGTAKLKFLHASPNAEALDLALQGGRVLFSGLNTGESSEYLQLPAGDYRLEVREAGTNHMLYQVPPISLQAGSLYTAIAEGLVSGSPAFKVVVVTDVSQ